MNGAFDPVPGTARDSGAWPFAAQPVHWDRRILVFRGSSLEVVTLESIAVLLLRGARLAASQQRDFFAAVPRHDG